MGVLLPPAPGGPSMRTALLLSLAALVCSCSSSGGPELWGSTSEGGAKVERSEGRGELRVEIQSPASNLRLSNWETSIEIAGGASVFGGVQQIDLMLVLDTSQSLFQTDPRDFRAKAAVGLVKSLSPRSDVQIGVVSFDWSGELILPLTSDRGAAIDSLQRLDRSGGTNLARGIRAALEELERGARPGSSRLVLLFTDGKSDAEKAHGAMVEARQRGVAIHSLLLGSDESGMVILEGIARGTGGTFVAVTDPD